MGGCALELRAWEPGSLGPPPSVLPLTGHPPKVAFTGWGLRPSVPFVARLRPEVQVVTPIHTLPPLPLYPEAV